MDQASFYPNVTKNIENPKGRDSKLDTKFFSIKTLSPVHIGSGFSLQKGIDFVGTRNHTFVLDMHKLMKEYGTNPRFTQAIERGNLGAFLDQEQADYSTLCITEVSGGSHAREINDQLRDGFGYPMIPGSSIKGSVKTALYAKLLKAKKISPEELTARLRSARGRLIDGAITQHLFAPGANGSRGKVPNYDIGRAFRVGDARFDKHRLSLVSNAILALDEGRGSDDYNAQWLELRGGRGGNQRHNTPHETVSVLGIQEGSRSSRFSLSFDRFLLEDPRLGMPNAHFPKDFKAFANMMNEHAASLIEKELDVLEQEVGLTNADVADYFDHLNDILASIPVPYTEEKNASIQWVQRIGWGSGWKYMTGGTLSSDSAIEIDKQETRQDRRGNLKGRFMKNYDPHLFPKTQKVVPNGLKGVTSMGWVLVKEIRNT